LMLDAGYPLGGSMSDVLFRIHDVVPFISFNCAACRRYIRPGGRR
jgi:hypothetical protein